jgi:hypothetical protein
MLAPSLHNNIFFCTYDKTIPESSEAKYTDMYLDLWYAKMATLTGKIGIGADSIN